MFVASFQFQMNIFNIIPSFVKPPKYYKTTFFTEFIELTQIIQAIKKYSEDTTNTGLDELNWINIENLLPEYKKNFESFFKL